jgi:hypothetical protein
MKEKIMEHILLDTQNTPSHGSLLLSRQPCCSWEQKVSAGGTDERASQELLSLEGR